MARHTNTVEVMTADQRRRRWSAVDKAALVSRAYEPGLTRIARGASGRGGSKPVVPVVKVGAPRDIDRSLGWRVGSPRIGTGRSSSRDRQAADDPGKLLMAALPTIFVPTALLNEQPMG